MRHRIKKIKFRAGSDSNQMLVKKLFLNFLKWGKITTTLKKTKVLKTVVERLIEKAKIQSEANKNYLMHYITDAKMTKFLFETVGPTLKKIAGGYVRIVRLGARASDGTEIARLEWAYPILVEKPKQDDKITNSKHQKPNKSQISNNK